MYTKKKTQKTFLFLLLTCLLSFFLFFVLVVQSQELKRSRGGNPPYPKVHTKCFPGGKVTKWLQLEVFSEQYITLSTKVHLVKAMVFPVVVYGCESWIIKKAERWRTDALKKKKNLCFWTVVLKILYSPLDSKEIKPVNPQRIQFWIFTGRTDAKAEAPILWLPDAKKWLTGKNPNAGKDWR